MLKHFWFLTLLFCSIFVVTGCGGGGGGGSTTPSTLSFAVNWPERTRDLNAPSSALSFTLTVTGGADTGDLTFQANRGDNLAAHRQTYSTSQRPKRGTFPFLVRFFAQANGEGAEVAVASGNVTVNGSTTLPTVSLTGTIATVEIPAGQMVDVGQTKSLSVEAKNAEGELVALSAGSFQWSIVSGAQFLTLSEGMFSGVANGIAKVRVAVDGRTSADTDVTVGGPIAVTYNVGTRLAWAAFQDGDGPWVPVTTLPVDGILRANVTDPSGRYGWAVVNVDPETPNRYYTDVRLTTVAEAQTLKGANPVFYPGNFDRRPITVNIANASGDVVFCGGGVSGVNLKNKTTYSGTMYRNVGTIYAYMIGQGVPKRMIIMRDIPDSVSEVTLDFTGPDSFKLEKVAYPIGVVSTRLYFSVANRTSLGYESPRVEEGGQSVFFLPPNSKLTENDYCVASGIQDVSAAQRLTVTNSTMRPEPIADYGFLSSWNPTATLADGAIQVNLPDQPEATSYSYSTFDSVKSASYTLGMSAGWHGPNAVTFTIPNFSALAGWQSQYVSPLANFRISAGRSNLSNADIINLPDDPEANDFARAKLGYLRKSNTWSFNLP